MGYGKSRRLHGLEFGTIVNDANATKIPSATVTLAMVQCIRSSGRSQPRLPESPVTCLC